MPLNPSAKDTEPEEERKVKSPLDAAIRRRMKKTTEDRTQKIKTVGY